MAVVLTITGEILENRRIEGGFLLLRVPFPARPNPGQFVMVRLPGQMDPFLGRPISVFDWADGMLSLLYQVAGRGTALLSERLPGQAITIQGPLGNGFPLIDSDITLIGGGVGIAPLNLLAKTQRCLYPNRQVAIHLGFREQPAMAETFAAVSDELTLNLGGYVTEDVKFRSVGRIYYACGPTPMLQAAATAAKAAGAALYVSLEERMACGVGACLGCTCKTVGGNKRVCKDGPVFPASEVF